MQKYKVFLEEKVIYFTDVELIDTPILDDLQPKDYNSLFNQLSSKNQCVVKYPDKSMFRFFQKFRFIEAAGGLVQHENKYLFIKRNGLWDIPKGKIEKNENAKETAIREIKEECGLTGDLFIRKKLTDTYHTYEFHNKSILKKTHWYFLEYIGDNSTKPQLEEGITEIIWTTREDFSTIQSNTYPSIMDVLSTFENS